MASGVGPLLNLLGKVNSNNALVVNVAASVSVPAATANGGVLALSNLQGAVDASNRLLVRFI